MCSCQPLHSAAPLALLSFCCLLPTCPISYAWRRATCTGCMTTTSPSSSQVGLWGGLLLPLLIPVPCSSLLRLRKEGGKQTKECMSVS